MFDRPTAMLYAAGLLSGLVIDIFPRSTELCFIADNNIVTQLSNPFGEDECDAFLSHLLLQANPSLPSLLRPTDPLEGEALQSAMRRLIFSLKRSNAIAFVSDLVKVRHQAEQVPGDLDSAQAPPVEAQDEGSNEVTQALMSGQLDNYIQKGGKESANQPVQAESNAPFNVAHPLDTSLPPIPIGPERHRWAEPLFDPTLLLQCGYTERDLETKLSLVEAVQNGARALPTAMPSQIRTSAAWEHVIIGNYAARVEDLGAAICIKLGSVLVDRHHRHPQDPYKSNPTFVKIPDYFSEFKGRPDWISYLGGCIMAKVC